jgi:hypothetical protein
MFDGEINEKTPSTADPTSSFMQKSRLSHHLGDKVKNRENLK